MNKKIILIAVCALIGAYFLFSKSASFDEEMALFFEEAAAHCTITEPLKLAERLEKTKHALDGTSFPLTVIISEALQEQYHTGRQEFSFPKKELRQHLLAYYTHATKSECSAEILTVEKISPEKAHVTINGNLLVTTNNGQFFERHEAVITVVKDGKWKLQEVVHVKNLREEN